MENATTNPTSAALWIRHSVFHISSGPAVLLCPGTSSVVDVFGIGILLQLCAVKKKKKKNSMV
jgi:hypothetical protein